MICVAGILVTESVSAAVRYTVGVATDSVANAPAHRPARPQVSRVDEVAVAASMAGLGIAGSVFIISGVGLLMVTVFSIIGIVLGLVSLRRIRESNGQRGGRLLAWLGLVMGMAGLAYIGLLLAAFSRLGRH